MHLFSPLVFLFCLFVQNFQYNYVLGFFFIVDSTQLNLLLIFLAIWQHFSFNGGLYPITSLPITLFTNNWYSWLWFCFLVFCFLFIKPPCFTCFMPIMICTELLFLLFSAMTSKSNDFQFYCYLSRKLFQSLPETTPNMKVKQIFDLLFSHAEENIYI
jgi:hypothetical protein